MKKLLIAILSIPFFTLVAIGQGTTWKDEHGDPVPESPAQKSRDGFGGWLITTVDSDWEEKWNTPSENIPQLNVASKISVGERVTTLVLFTNALVGEDGLIDVRCDLRVTRPNGTTSIDVEDFECYRGPIEGDPYALRMTAATIEFVGEPGDPLGEWVTEVTLTDANRRTSLDLRSVVELAESES